ncbi:unnamed protein product [Pylaiella littoralis]
MAAPADHRSTSANHPSTWPDVASTMHGFPFPELPSCREVIVPRPEATEDPDLVVLPGGETFYLQPRRLATSLFGVVLHGIEGRCSNPDEPSTFLMPRKSEEQTQVAVKMSSLAKMKRAPQENVFREISVMRYLSEGTGHPHVMPLVAACMSETHVYVVTPFFGGGDLLKMVVPDEGTGEQRARKWFGQIFLALAYVHGKGLCHHDFSPENVVIDKNGDAAVVMDFGMVQRMTTGPLGEVKETRDAHPFGKMRYMSPEIWENKEYDGRQADIWSAGVTLLVCLLGEYLWVAPTRTPLESRGIYSSDIYSYSTLEEHGVRVMLDRLNFTSRMSAAAVDLLCHVLVVDRAYRPCLANVLVQHPFFAELL